MVGNQYKKTQHSDVVVFASVVVVVVFVVTTTAAVSSILDVAMDDQRENFQLGRWDRIDRLLASFSL